MKIRMAPQLSGLRRLAQSYVARNGLWFPKRYTTHTYEYCPLCETKTEDDGCCPQCDWTWTYKKLKPYPWQR